MKEKPHKEFGKAFVRLREKNKLGDAEIQKATGISLPNLWHYAQGNSFPSRPKLQALAKLFNCSIDELMGVEK